MADPGAALKELARAVELQQRGRLDDAEALYAKLLEHDDRDPTVLINAGVLAMARGDVAAAVARLEKAVAVVPQNAIAHGNLGFALMHAGRDAEALEALDRAIRHKPDFAQAHNNRGIALARLQRHEDAIRAFESALALLPAYAEAAINLGELCNQAGATDAARRAYDRVLARDPHHVAAGVGVAFSDALDGHLEASLAALEGIVARHPQSAPAWQVLGSIRQWAWQHEAAEAAHRRALVIDPDAREARFGLASALLARGDYARGFEAFDLSRAGDAVSDASGLRTLPVWNGEASAGTLVVHGEQGLGDVVQFARFIPGLRSRVGRLVLHLEGYWAPLAPLLASLDGVDAITTEAEALREEKPAARVSVLSFPRIAEAMPGHLPVAPYLRAPPDRVESWARELGERRLPRVGIAWSVHARSQHAYVTQHKSLTPEALRPLVETAGVEFHSLQPGSAGDPSVFGDAARRVAPSGRKIRDFGDTAALIAALDLVITPDTAVAHVAGALGKPVWLLERFHGCWRWRLDAGTSPWYPGLRIFRQARFGDWSEPVARAVEGLARWHPDRLDTEAPGR